MFTENLSIIIYALFLRIKLENYEISTKKRRVLKHYFLPLKVLIGCAERMFGVRDYRQFDVQYSRVKRWKIISEEMKNWKVFSICVIASSLTAVYEFWIIYSSKLARLKNNNNKWCIKRGKIMQIIINIQINLKLNHQPFAVVVFMLEDMMVS